jgi:hypothetical protein
MRGALPCRAKPLDAMTRAIYLIGHNTNALEEIERGLAGGLNAFEIDLNIDANREIFVSHDPVDSTSLGFESPPRLVPFLQGLRQIVDSDERVSLVVFDLKFIASDLGARVLRAVRDHLTSGSRLHVIYSIAKIEQARTLFEPFLADLAPNEGLMIDEEADPAAVSQFFARHNVSRACYANGITTVVGVGLPTPNLITEMDLAVALRSMGQLHFVYPWVLVEADTIREFLRIGVNGIMVDADNSGTLTSVVAEPELTARLHPARRGDDPFAIDHSLLLEVRTVDAAFAGTDARITITLTPKHGPKVLRSLDARSNGRFERGSVTFVSCCGIELAPDDISAISVVHDGAGQAPNWRLHSITLRRHGFPDKTVVFDCEIGQHTSVTRGV